MYKIPTLTFTCASLAHGVSTLPFLHVQGGKSWRFWSFSVLILHCATLHRIASSLSKIHVYYRAVASLLGLLCSLPSLRVPGSAQKVPGVSVERKWGETVAMWLRSYYPLTW